MSEQQSDYPQSLPAQHQDRHPGTETEMQPRPRYEGSAYQASGRLQDKTAIITGGDSGIGRAVAIAYAEEGADVAIVYHGNDADAQETRRHVEAAGRQCLLIKGDVREGANSSSQRGRSC